jgi:hypothetical protein
MVLITDNQYREYNAHQKASYVTFLLLQGNELTTAGIATLTGLTWDGAEYMMDMISGVLPIVKVGGKWRKMD